MTGKQDAAAIAERFKKLLLPELEKNAGKPEVFVIGGAGTGIPVYRNLQRQGIPFAAGVLHENDLDFPCAKAPAAQVISAPPFEEIGDDSLQTALSVLRNCRKVICTLEHFGTMNAKNQILLENAIKLQLLK